MTKDRLRLWALAGMVAGLVVTVHWPVLSATAMSFDDQQYVLHNRLVLNPSLVSAARFMGEVRDPSTVHGYYQPLAMISLMLDAAAGGRPDYFRPFHRTSLALHVLNTLLVMAIVQALFGQPYVAAAVALLFGLHPLTVEPIAWVGERKTPLAAFFALSAIATYIGYARARSSLRLAATALLYVLALLSKPTSTPLPVILLLLDWWPLRRLSGRALLEKLPLFALGGLSAIITVVSQTASAITILPGEYPPLRIPLVLCHNVIFYLHKLLWPTGLSPHYAFPEPMSLAHGAVAAGVIGSVMLAAVLLLSLRWTRAWLAGWLIFFAAALPTMGVIGFTDVIAADKFAYLPAIGLLAALAATAGELWRHAGARLRGVLVVVLLVALAAEARATRRQLGYWADSDTLSGRVVALAPQSPSARGLRGAVMFAAGRLEEAIEQYSAATSLRPEFAEAHHNLGAAIALKGDLDTAIVEYREAIRYSREPNPDVHYDLGTALALSGELGEAIEQFRQALRLNPELPEVHFNLAIALAQTGRPADSAAHLREALRLRPGWPEAEHSLAAVLAQ
ncbi:MAG: tetratricopeptide repeat protein [Deltaproteobacteria bacterium]|nr:tetratricopeptide repeat protein [Deltaproteobacteria bacterium]